MKPVPRSFEELIEIWKETSKQPSNNLASNAPLPDNIRNKLFQDPGEIDNVIFEPKTFPETYEIPGFEILKGLQNTFIPNYMTLFRAIRFPTPKRINNLVEKEGFSLSNYEQERLESIYKDPKYIKKREEALKIPGFIIPQERIVNGIPAFPLANDAIQIHKAYRTSIDKIVLIALFIPNELLESGEIELYSNTDIDYSLDNDDRDRRINKFVKNDNGKVIPITNAYEAYLKGLPMNIEACSEKNIKQKYFLLDIYKFRDFYSDKILRDISFLLKYESLLKGFMGDNALGGRNKSEYLPFKCSEIKKN